MSDTETSQPITSIDVEIKPHLKTTLYFTFAFCVAWGWDLVIYAISHVKHGTNPLEMQLSFGDQPGPKKLIVLCLEFLFACAIAAAVTSMLDNDNCKWKKAAITSVGFFPAPIFGGKLMAYLGQFMSLGTMNRALINLAASIFAAVLASFVPTNLQQPFTKFGSIVRESMGFGLGISWNMFLQGIFAPDEMDASHIIGLAGYLALVALITFRVAAQVELTDEPTTIERFWILLTFAMQTVTAFTLVAFIDALTADGWTGHFENLFILLLFAAIISALVARIDIARLDEHDSNDDEDNCGLDHLPCVLKLLVFFPCCWIFCPWAPLVFLLSGVNGIGIKEKWFQVSNMIGGLAASIEASGMLTLLTNQISAGLGFCTEKKCIYPWIFVMLQAGVALTITIILIPLLIQVVPDFLMPPSDPNEESEDVHEEIKVTKHNKPIEYITAEKDDVSLLSFPASKYSSV